MHDGQELEVNEQGEVRMTTGALPDGPAREKAEKLIAAMNQIAELTGLMGSDIAELIALAAFVERIRAREYQKAARELAFATMESVFVEYADFMREEEGK